MHPIAVLSLLLLGPGCVDEGPAPVGGGDSGGGAYRGEMPDYSICDWGSADCLDGCDSPEDQVWADGYMARMAEAWGMSVEETTAFVQVRSIDRFGVPTSQTTIRAQLRAEWVLTTLDVTVDFPGQPSSVDEAQAAFNPDRYPVVDVRSAPTPFDEVQEFVRSCEEEQGVSFPDRQWCHSYISSDPLDDDQQGVRFDLYVELEPPHYAYATIYAWGSEPNRCGLNEYPVD